MILYDNTSWLRIIFRLQGNIIASIWPQILINMVVGVVAQLCLVYFGDKAYLPMNSGLIAITSVVAFLIVIRTQISFARFWEARTHLDSSMKSCTVLVMQCLCCYSSSRAGKRDSVDVIRLVLMFWVLQAQQIQELGSLDDVEHLLMPHERHVLEGVNNRPVIVLTWVRLKLQSAWEERSTIQDLRSLHRMHDSVGDLVSSFNGVTKIASTPIPFGYIHMLRTFLFVIVFSLPFTLSKTLSLYISPVISGLIAFAFFGVDFLGAEIEEPFGMDPNDLPILELSEQLDKDINALLAARSTYTPMFSQEEKRGVLQSCWLSSLPPVFGQLQTAPATVHPHKLQPSVQVQGLS